MPRPCSIAKTDLIDDEEWLDLVKKRSGSPLRHFLAVTLPVPAHRHGLDELIKPLMKLQRAFAPDEKAPLRLPGGQGLHAGVWLVVWHGARTFTTAECQRTACRENGRSPDPGTRHTAAGRCSQRAAVNLSGRDKTLLSWEACWMNRVR